MLIWGLSWGPWYESSLLPQCSLSILSLSLLEFSRSWAVILLYHLRPGSGASSLILESELLSLSLWLSKLILISWFLIFNHEILLSLLFSSSPPYNKGGKCFLACALGNTAILLTPAWRTGSDSDCSLDSQFDFGLVIPGQT